MSADPVTVPEVTSRHLPYIPWHARRRVLERDRAAQIREARAERERAVHEPVRLPPRKWSLREMKAANSAYEAGRPAPITDLPIEQQEALRAYWVLRRTDPSVRKVRVPTLTRVLGMAADGQGLAEIAMTMGVKPSTVRDALTKAGHRDTYVLIRDRDACRPNG